MERNFLPPPRPGPPRVVGVVHDAASLRAALSLAPAGAPPDLLELRADGFAPAGGRPGWRRESLGAPGLLDFLGCPPRPLILTVRDPREGGARPWLHAGRRAEILRDLLEALAPRRPAYVDVELRNLAHPSLAFLVNADAAGAGNGLIASFHDFESTPPARRLRALAGRAAAGGASVFKVATRLNHPGDLARLLEFLHGGSPLPLAVMGMGGPLGLASRPALAAAGSALNYGYLGDAPAVPGQWPAAVLSARIEELIGEGASTRGSGEGKAPLIPG